MFETGLFYSIFVDPILKGIRKKVVAQVAHNETVIDIACGTGAQGFEIAAKAKRLVGVDLSKSMIRFAQRKSQRQKLQNIEFCEADATQLLGFRNKEFDVATMSLALHQFSPKIYASVLSEMKRIAQRVVIIDYAVPLQNNIVGSICKTIEFMAGVDHNRCFRSFCNIGGGQTILRNNGFVIERQEKFAGGAFYLFVCRAA